MMSTLLIYGNALGIEPESLRHKRLHISSGSSQYSEPTPDTPPRAPPRSHFRPLARALVHDVFRLAPGAAGGRGRLFVLASIKYGNHALPPSSVSASQLAISNVL